MNFQIGDFASHSNYSVSIHVQIFIKCKADFYDLDFKTNQNPEN
jgi:hypothetical protein